MATDNSIFAERMNALARDMATVSVNHGFWDERYPEEVQIPRKLALIHSEVTEALKEHRDLPQDPDTFEIDAFWNSFTEELADVVIRALDIAGYYGLDIGHAIIGKHNKNADRPHMHGKRY